MPESVFDTIIIGAGPAGCSAAIYTGRANLKTLIFGKGDVSHLYKSHLIANYYGFPEDITGPQLWELGLKQALKFGAKHRTHDVVNITINDDQTFTVKDETQALFTGKTIILAVGTSYPASGILREIELTGKGVSFCVTCDGFFFKEKNVVVVGNTNFAAEEAIELFPYTKKITILSHGQKFLISDSFLKVLQEQGVVLKETPRIKEYTGATKVEGGRFVDGAEFRCDGVFLALGTAGSTSFAKKLGIAIKGNAITVDADGQTNIPGIFAAGNCTGSNPQVAVSVGNGCIAGIGVIKMLTGAKRYVQY